MNNLIQNIKHNKLIKKILICFITVFVISCEDVVELDLPTTEPKLVIDASINWFKGTSGNEQAIKLSLSAPYYTNHVTPANNADVIITDSNNNTYFFIEDENTGIYQNNNFTPIINETYTLNISYKGEEYIATETLKPVADIEYVEQNLEGGFSGEDTEIKAFFTDPAEEENFYFFEFSPSLNVTSTLSVLKDEFVNGNEIFGFYVEEDLNPGQSVVIRNYGVSQRFYEFMFVLLQQSGQSGGGPFETQPATVRGNCINQTNPENYPFGYFRLSEVSEINYTIE
ncbi:uncharacterized protein DUF4249 [Oceanihabitans sediminis]|uniref:DUF4249 domain-containing protein n=1 Tax=Oceanihabitans sediminis TaxID=1812012 RepID=A0A368P7B2_9FLAO|nr:DUF4249 family protein [Oceanihabitans sediminis]MDX1774828.1 DUF4249 family protein [Oceanihabitans sediminis]RBP32671.1 uncharacterized protein DUF4249 [Oceanihabitans sediminis]RCU57785.1 DUF4249 domain-containing protein [Oceanihabitans sediminis]